MWSDPLEAADLVTFMKKSLMEYFIFCAGHLVKYLITSNSHILREKCPYSKC